MRQLKNLHHFITNVIAQSLTSVAIKCIIIIITIIMSHIKGLFFLVLC